MIMDQAGFYLWWLLVNSVLAFAEIWFLSHFSDGLKRRRGLYTAYIGAICAFTFLVLSFPTPVFLRELLHIGVFVFFAVYVIKCNWANTVISALIIFTLSTFREGLSAVLMRWVCVKPVAPLFGNVFQLLLSFVLSLLFFLSLRFIAKRYAYTARQTISPWLYALLLPCVFVVWVVRFGFGLNNIDPEYVCPPFAKTPLLWALLIMAAAAAAFSMSLKSFDKIMMLTRRETENALQNEQRREQEIYLSEAKKREERYRCFQHDIDNHLSILSGLLQDGNYSGAKQYIAQVRSVSSPLLLQISTGNPVLDVLLSQKINYASQNHISVICQAVLPPNLPVSDMDLCIILANALDNAIHACMNSGQTQPDIIITIRPRHHFLLLEITNSMRSASGISQGTGLMNIRRTVDKYQGSLEIAQSDGRFRLSALLCLSPSGTEPNTKQKQPFT